MAPRPKPFLAAWCFGMGSVDQEKALARRVRELTLGYVNQMDSAGFRFQLATRRRLTLWGGGGLLLAQLSAFKDAGCDLRARERSPFSNCSVGAEMHAKRFLAQLAATVTSVVARDAHWCM